MFTVLPLTFSFSGYEYYLITVKDRVFWLALHYQTPSLFYGLFYDTGHVVAKHAWQDNINKVSVIEHIIFI